MQMFDLSLGIYLEFILFYIIKCETPNSGAAETVLVLVNWHPREKSNFQFMYQ